MSIPDKAVEAAARTIRPDLWYDPLPHQWEFQRSVLMDAVRAGLEAAEPYLTGGADVDAIRSVVVGHKAFEFAFTTDSGIVSAQEALIAGLLKALAAHPEVKS